MKRIDVKSGLKCLIVILIVAIGEVVTPSYGQNETIDSLLIVVKTDKSDTNKVIHLNGLCREYRNIGNYDKASYYANSALLLAQQINYKKGIANAFGNIGIIFSLQASYPQALDYLLKALKIDENLKDKNGRLNRLLTIGVVYMNCQDYSKALNYDFQALKIAQELKDKNKVAMIYANIGNVCMDQRNYQKALDYAFQALKIAEELRDTNSIAGLFCNIGSLYDLQKDYSKALDYYFKALKMAENINDIDNVSNILANIGALYSAMKKFDDAEKYLLKALKMSKEMGAMVHEWKFEELLSQLYEQTDREKLALIHYKKAIVLKDTILSQENKKELVRKEMNYEFEKKEAVNKAEQDAKDVIAKEERQRQKIITYSVSIGFFLVVLLALFIFRGYKQKQKTNRIIRRQKTEVENQKELVEIKNKEIIDSINYAKRIQQAKLPNKEEIYALLPKSFVLFKPKDIVSGDFYFCASALCENEQGKGQEVVFIAAADCTGHGVPGAFMSMIGSEKLEDAVLQTKDTSGILKLLNIGIKASLRQSEDSDSTKDGMDIALCSVDLENCIVNYTGANRPIWIVRKDSVEVVEIKATKKAIGGFTENNQYFDSHKIKLQQGDTFYIFTDGYADQFGGKDGKKLMTKKFKEVLLAIQDKPMPEQEVYLNTFVDDWRGNREQIDDILVIGVRL